jgi:hypothetical protein
MREARHRIHVRRDLIKCPAPCAGPAAANVNTKLETARTCLLNPDHDGVPKTPHPETPPSWRDLVFALTGIDLLVCPVCGDRSMERRPLGGAPASTRTPDTS